jgi:hypothetical protein
MRAYICSARRVGKVVWMVVVVVVVITLNLFSLAMSFWPISRAKSEHLARTLQAHPITFFC